MAKVIIILLSIFGLVILVFFWFFSKVKKALGINDSEKKKKSPHKAENSYDDVLYNKDDVVVLKGEAGKHNSKDKK